MSFGLLDLYWTFVIVLPSLVVEPVSDLVPYDPPDAAVVKILGTILAEENSLNKKTTFMYSAKLIELN